MSEIVTPLWKRVMKNGDTKYIIGPDHTIGDICRHLHETGCADDAICILLGLTSQPQPTTARAEGYADGVRAAAGLFSDADSPAHAAIKAEIMALLAPIEAADVPKGE